MIDIHTVIGIRLITRCGLRGSEPVVVPAGERGSRVGGLARSISRMVVFAVAGRFQLGDGLHGLLQLLLFVLVLFPLGCNVVLLRHQSIDSLRGDGF